VAVEVGVRELRRHLSDWLDRAAAGQEVIVTERGRPKARLGPLSTAEEVIERLVREGRAIPPSRPRGSLPPPIPMEGSIMPFLEWARGGPWPGSEPDPADDGIAPA
jgi:prevent-host-death family protein